MNAAAHNFLKRVLSRHDLRFKLGLFLGVGLFCAPSKSDAGVFNIPRFVSPGQWGLGIEPELHFNSGGPASGINLRYTQGISELSNGIILMGTGAGQRGFRAGGALTLDIFPDIGTQPGIGVAVEGLYIQLPNAGSVQITGIPYLHKTFKIPQGNELEPFIAFPVGLSLSQGAYQTLVTAAFGGIFQNTEQLKTVFEIGVGLNSASNTYISGGVIYYH